MHEYVEVGVAALEAREDAREEVGAHHRRHADLDGSLLELLVVVDLQHGVLDVAQRELDSVEEDGALRRQCELFLAAVEELDAELGLELLDGDRDVRLGNTQAFRSAGDISQTAGHLEIFELSEFHSNRFFLFHFICINSLYLMPLYHIFSECMIV